MSSRSITMYGIPNCDTVKKSRTWLDENNISFHFHNFKKDGLDAQAIQTWLQSSELAILINRKGTTWRALDDANKAKAEQTDSAIELMMSQPSVIKRPVLVITKDGQTRVHVGFTADLYQALFL